MIGIFTVNSFFGRVDMLATIFNEPLSWAGPGLRALKGDDKLFCFFLFGRLCFGQLVGRSRVLEIPIPIWPQEEEEKKSQYF